MEQDVRPREFAWIYNQQRRAKRRRSLKAATRHHVTLGSGHVPDCSRSKNAEKLRWFDALRWLCSRFLKVEKQGETKNIRCLEMTLYESHKIKGKEKAAEVSPLISTSAAVCTSSAIFDSFFLYLSLSVSVSLSFSRDLLLYPYIQNVIKGKVKNKLKFYSSVLLSFSAIQQ